MHELSIVYELYRTVTQLAAEAGCTGWKRCACKSGSCPVWRARTCGSAGMLWCEIRRFVLPGWSWSTCRLLPCVRIVPACMLIWPVPALAPVAVATIISFCPAANFSSTGSRGIKNQPTTVRLFAQSSAFICFFELTVGGVEPDHAWTAGEKMTRTGVPERQYFAANLQIGK